MASETVLDSRSPAQNLTHRPPGLIDGHIRIRAGPRMRIRNGDLAKRFPPSYPRLLSVLPLRIKQRARRVGIAVRPAIDRDASDVARWIESRAAQHSAQLVAN